MPPPAPQRILWRMSIEGGLPMTGLTSTHSDMRGHEGALDARSWTNNHSSGWDLRPMGEPPRSAWLPQRAHPSLAWQAEGALLKLQTLVRLDRQVRVGVRDQVPSSLPATPPQADVVDPQRELLVRDETWRSAAPRPLAMALSSGHVGLRWSLNARPRGRGSPFPCAGPQKTRTRDVLC